MYCQNCGRDIPDKSEFCGSCGAQQAQVNIQTTTARYATRADRRRDKSTKTNRTLIIIFAILAIAAAAGALLSQRVTGYTSPTKLIKTYVESFEKNDAAEISKMTPAAAASRWAHRKGESRDNYAKEIDAIYELYGSDVTDWTVTEIYTETEKPSLPPNVMNEAGLELADLQAVATYALSLELAGSSGAESCEVKLTLAKYDGAWHLISVKR